MLIAGKNAGKPVTLGRDQEIRNAYRGLEIRANNNELWAVNAVRELKSLASGHWKESVYIQKDIQKMTIFRVILPGVTAAVAKTERGYKIFYISVDDTYYNQQVKYKKPALFHVEKSSDTSNARWIASTKPVTANHLAQSKHSKVAITDRRTKVSDSADEGAAALISSPIANEIDMKTFGFHLHFTPGKQSIGGLKHWTQACNVDTDKSLIESSKMLADTMLATRTTQGISWVSEGGGSGILTQAMKILVDKGINFKDSNHSIFFDGMTTNQSMAENYARQLNMVFDRKISKINPLNIDQLFGSDMIGGGEFVAAFNRFKSDPQHGVLKLCRDTSDAIGGARGAGATTTACMSALGIALPLQGDLTLTPLVAATAAAGAAAFPIGKKLFEAWTPRLARKIKNKF